jgi:type IV secretion system protein VirD4
MLPQELIQMPPDRLLVLRAGLPPVRGRKITYWRERPFIRRVRPAPPVAARALPAAAVKPAHRPTADAADPDRLTLDLLLPALEAEGAAPLPDEGASPEAVEAWVNDFIDRSARIHEETVDGR